LLLVIAWHNPPKITLGLLYHNIYQLSTILKHDPIQATEAIKIALCIGRTLKGRLLTYNSLDMTFCDIELSKNSDCLVCGANSIVNIMVV